MSIEKRVECTQKRVAEASAKVRGLPPSRKKGLEQDSQMLRQDWQMLGRDMRIAMRRLMQG